MRLIQAKVAAKNNDTEAMEKALEWGDRIPTGIFYRNERPVFEDTLWQADRIPLIKRKTDLQIVSRMIDEFK